jgi:hypothetical protein
VATGMGSCNSYEGKYRWRDLKRVCPECGQATIIKGKEEYGGGYICWKKEGKSDGCGAKFADDDKQITGQTVGRIENDDIATLKNTILKMSKKRAKIDATLSATRSSGIFTQDMEDIAAAEAEQVKAHQAQHARGGAEKTKQAQKPGEATIQLVSAEERKAIFDVAKESGFKSKPEIMAYLLGQFGVKSTDEITATMYPKVLDALRAQGSQHPASSTNQQPVANQAAQAPAGKIISDQQKGIVHLTARRTGWEKGSGRPEDPLHQFLRREPFCVDSVAKVREDHFNSIIDALMKDPTDFGFTRES